MASEPLTDDEQAELMAMEIREYLDLRGMTNDKEVTLEEIAAYLISLGYKRGKK
jgi:hypothetical protein